MKKNIFSAIFMAALMLFSSIAFTSCNQEELETDPFKGTVAMAGYAPNPVARGGELYFIGSNLDQVTKVIFQGDEVEVTDFVSKTADTLRVIVPKTAQPGVIKLIAGDKTLTSRAALAFTEPVAFAEKEALSGTNFMPGDTLKIKGSYLNLVKDVVFAGDAYSPVIACGNNTENEPMDMWLTVKVPAAALSGKIKLSFYATGSSEENLVPSEEAIDVFTHQIAEPVVIAAGLPGETHKVAGINLQLVTLLESPAGDSIKFTVNEAGTELSFVVPEYITNGTIMAVSASGVGRRAFDFTLFFPAEVNADKVTDLRGGDSIVLSGTHVELVEKVIFPTKSGSAEAVVSTNRKVGVPALAYPGKLKLVTMAEEREVELTIAMLHPTYTSHDKAIIEAEDTVTFVGKDLDLISAIEIVGIGKSAEYIVEKKNASMKVVFPMGSKSGMLKVTLVNEEVMDFAEVTMSLPNGCYVPNAEQLISTDAMPMQAGDVISIDVENIDRLVGVLIDGEDVTYIVNPDKDNAEIGKLYISTPATAKSDFVLTLVSDNDIQTYDLKLIPSNARTKVIWEGEHAAGGWAAGFGNLSWGGYDWSTVKVGSILKVDFAIDPAAEYDPAIRLGNGSWASLPGVAAAYPEADGDGNIPCADKTSVELTLSAADLNELQNNGGLVVCGAWFIVTRVRLTEFLPVGHSIWEGEEVVAGWSGSLGALSWGGYDWSTVTEGTKLHIDFYINPLAEYDPVIRIGNGSWATLPSALTTYPEADGDGNIPCADKTFVEITLTADDLNKLVNEGGLVVCGAWFVVTNVSLVF